eukprot:g7695.t1
MGCLPALVPAQGVIGIYGVGAGTVPRIIHEFFPTQKMRGWELDPDIIDLARTHMDLTNLEKSKSLEVFIGDCISESAVVSGGFTGLIVDIYLDDKTHPSLSEVEIWRSLRSRLKAGGRIMANLEPEHLPILHEVFSGDLQWHMHQPSGNLLALTGPYPTDEEWSGIPSALANLGEILDIAIPTFCAGLLNPICTAADTAVVGRLGTLQLSGVGIGAVVFMFISSLFSFCQLLVTPEIAKANAQNDDEKVSKMIAQSIIVGSTIGLLAGLVMFIFILNPPMEVRTYAVIYLQVMATSIPPYVLWQCLAGIFRGLHEPSMILKASGLATILNVILDIVFVFGFGWGVFGAAFATSLCTYVSSAIMLLRILTSGKVKRSDFVAPSWSSSDGGSSLIASGAALIIRSMTLLTLIVCSSVLAARQGPVLHSVYEICRLVFLVFHGTYTAFDFTMQAICASYIGKKDRSGAREVLIRALQMVILLTSIMGGALWMFSIQFVRLFTTDLAIINEFHRIAHLVFAPMPFAGIAAVLDGSLLGAQRVGVVASLQVLFGSLSLIGLFVFDRCNMFTLPLAVVLVRLGLSVQGVISWWFAMKVEYKQTIKA